MAPRPILKRPKLPEFRRRSSGSITFSPSSSPSYLSESPYSPSSTTRDTYHALPFAGLTRPGMLTPHVHFPPTPSIASTEPTHSSALYDRAPIVVSPNSCELPERGERTYMDVEMEMDTDGSWRKTKTIPGEGGPEGSYFHPLAFRACERVILDVPAPSAGDTPALIPDSESSESSLSSSSSSESDDSDGYGLPLLSLPIPPGSLVLSSSPHSYSHSHSHPHSQVLFVPHPYPGPPSPPSPPSSNTCSRDQGSNLNNNNLDLTRVRPRKSFCRPRSFGSGADAFKEPHLDGCLGGF